MTLEELHVRFAEVNKNSMWLSQRDKSHYTSSPMCLHIINSPVRADTQPPELYCFTNYTFLKVCKIVI